MSTSPTDAAGAARIAAKVPPPSTRHIDGLLGAASLDDQTEKRLDEIEMIGEEEAAGLPAGGHSAVTPGMRYLHCSRTIHQLVTDRNRAVEFIWPWHRFCGRGRAPSSMPTTTTTFSFRSRRSSAPVCRPPLEFWRSWHSSSDFS